MSDEAADLVLKQMLDDIILGAKKDSELEGGIKWIDEQGTKQGVDFYEVAIPLIRRYCAEKRAREWNNSRSA